MDSISEIIANALDNLDRAIDNLPYVSADQIGLDRRAGMVWVDVDGGLIISTSPGGLNYYGGFEYVDDESKMKIGPYMIYAGKDNDHFDLYGCGRVEQVIEYFEQHNEND